MYKDDRDDAIEVSFLEVLQILLHKWYLILMCGVVFGAVALGFTKFFITPQYEASSMIYILSKTTSISSALDLQLSKQLTVDFETLAKSRPVVESVIEDLSLNTDYETLVKTINVTNPASTSILKISVQNPDAELACDISNAMSDATANQIAKVMVTDKPSTVEKAIVPKNPVSPNPKKNTFIAALAGVFIMCAILIFRYLMDDRIKTEEDIIKYLELNVLASIPVNKGFKGPDRKKDKGKKDS